MAVLFTQTPDAPIFKVAPFNSTRFREFAATSTAAIQAAEETARIAFQNLPEHLIASMHDPTPATDFFPQDPPPVPIETALPTLAFQRIPAATGSSAERQQYYFQRYGAAHFRKHSPEWLNGDWVPHYKYAAADAIWDYWIEWEEGVNGFIAVEELMTAWAAKWRCNNSALKSENTRRMRVINLILALSKKLHWNINLVRRFITEKAVRVPVIAAANSYPKLVYGSDTTARSFN
ncbi:hypothetical protein C8J57DRAFT_1519115 [Mycena rebaudengoi]|nr:hypothetical protein C8J57DRAFT_1519115 [Mycena rebaudengoi]